MLTENLRARIESYINEHRRTREKFKARLKELSSKGALCINYPSKEKIEERLRRIKATFPQYLLNFIAERGFDEIDVYKRAHLDRRIFSKLRNQKDYMPSKRTVLLIIFAMELPLDEALRLLGKGGYSLSELSRKDVIIKFFLENQIYDLFLVNEVLDHYGFKPLSS